MSDPFSVDPSEPELRKERRSFVARLLGPLVVLGGILLKFGIFSIKFFGIFISVAAYALLFGWWFGVGLVILILVHEMGHYLEARRLGLNPALPVFIPFLGAYVALRNAPFDPWRNARVALAGPLVGGLGALVLLGVGEAQDSRLILALAYTGFFLNLINLLPFGPLDGAHIMRAWQVLRRGGGRTDPLAARRLGRIVLVASILTVAFLVSGMVAAHIPQTRL